MSIDRKTIAAIVLCLLAYLGWEQYLNKKYPNRFKKPTPSVVQSGDHNGNPKSNISGRDGNGESTATPASRSPSNLDSAAAGPAVTPLSPQALTLETATSRYVFDPSGSGIASLSFKNFESDERGQPMEILPNGALLSATSSERQQAPSLKQGRREDGTLIFSHRQGPWLIEEAFTPEATTYGAHLVVTWKNQGQEAHDLTPAVTLTEKVNYSKATSSFLPGSPTAKPALIAGIGLETSRRDIFDYCEEGKEAKEPLAADMQEVDYVGFDKQYFLKVLIPQSKKMSLRARAVSREPGVSCTLATSTYLPYGRVAPGETVTLRYKAWFGPKDTDLLAAYEPKLEDSIDLGFFSKISHPLLAALQGIYGYVGNWGLAIILLTTVLKLLFYPLTRQAAVAQRKMKKLQPEIERLKEKHRDDPRTQQQEIMRFMASNKINPMKGCLPVLPTIPVFFAFFRVLSTSIELRHAPFYGWITDLSASDPYYVTPLIMGVLMLVQHKLTPTAGMDKTQERIMMMLPLFFTVMMLTLPAGLVLYMLTNTAISIAQQQWLNRRLA